MYRLITNRMNQYVESNKESAKELQSLYGSVREAYFSGPWGNFTKSFKCVECGEFVSGFVMKFYNYDFESVLCHACQKKESLIK